MTELYIFSQREKPLTILSEDTGLVSAPYRIEVNSVPDKPFSFTVEADHENAVYVKEENKVVFKDHEGDWRLMVIREIDDSDTAEGPETTATCEPVFLAELTDHIVVDRRFVEKTANLALDAALAGTRWIGEVLVELGVATTNFYYLSSVEAMWNILSTWGGEVKDVVEFDEETNEIKACKIQILQRRGTEHGQRFEIDHNTTEIGRTILSYPKTALYGRGASIPVEDDEGEHTGGFTRYIDFADVEWSVSKGHPVDKPKGQLWVGDPKDKDTLGHEDANGNMKHRFGIFSNQEYENPEELIWATWQNLQENKYPVVHYRLSVDLLDDKVSLGDTAIAIDRQFSRPIEIQTRIIAMEYDLLDMEGTMVVEMGQFLDLEDKRLDDLEEEVQKIRDRPQQVTNGSYPDIKPGTPINVTADGGMEVIQLYWEYASEIFIKQYEVYGSQIKGFIPDSQHLLWRGRTSSFAHTVGTDQVWYYRIRAVNYHGTASDWSVEVNAATHRVRSDDILFGPEIAEKLRELDLIANGSIGLDKIKQEALDSIQQDARLYTDAEIKATEVSLMSELANKTGFDYVDGKLFLVNEELLNKVDNGVYQNKIFQIDNSLDGLSLRAQNVEADVIELNGEVGNALSQISAVDIKANKISTSVSELKSEFDGMVIGTRNLILNSSFRNGEKWGGITRFTNGPQGMRAAEISRSGYEGTQRSTLYQTTALRGKTLVEEGKTYTLSGWFYIDSSIPLDSDSTSILVRKYRTGSTQVNDFINVIIRLSDYQYDKWYYFEKTGTVPAGYVGNDQVALALGKNGKIAVSMLKLEEGTKASSWTPAPEDIESRVSSAETKIDQTAYDLTFKASQTSVDSLTGRMVDAESSIKLMSDEIGFKVDRDGIISAINLQPGTVQIEARLIDLKGDVYITNGRTVISDLAVTNAALANASISRAKLQDAVIGSAQIENGAITNAKIGNAVIDDAKIANVSVNKLLAGTIDTSKVKVRGGSSIEYTEINGAHLGIYGEFTRTFRNGSATYRAFVDSYGGTFRAGITSKRVGSNNYNNVFRWTALTDKGLTTQRAVHSGSDDYNGARFIDFYADETLSSDVQGLGMHIYSGQSMTIESNYALDLKHSMDYMTNLTSGGLRVNANNTGLVLKRTTRYDTNQGQSIQFKSWDDTTMAIIDQPNNNYNLHMYTKFGDYIILGARQEIHIKDTEGNNWRNVVASGFKRNDGYSAYINGTGTGNTKGAGDVSGTNEDGVPVLMSSAMRIRNSDTNMFLAVASNGEVYVTDLHGRGGSPIGYRPIRASAFNQQSSRQYKTNIEKLDNIGIATINSLTVVSYDLKMDIENNIYNPQVGLISEDSASVATIDGKGIDIYKLSSFNTKAIQELVEEVNWLKLENQYLRKRIEKLEAA